MSATPVLSVVGPVFNEESALPLFHSRLTASLEALGLPWEVVYVDDGSRDGTPALLAKMRAADARVKFLRLSRNFGHQVAITAGLDHATGEAVVIMDTDGQDPPELIGRLVERWRAGDHVVYAVRTRRESETVFKRLTAAVFYRLLRSMTHLDIPVDAGDFRLLDRRVAEVLRQMRESHRFVRGMTSWAGFTQGRVEYDRAARLAGETHYPFFKMLHFALDALTSFSNPLRLVFYLGLGAFIAAVVTSGWALYIKLFTDRAVQGWASLMAATLFTGSVQLISVGVIGEYMGRILDEVKRRPLYALSAAEGFLRPKVIGLKLPNVETN